MNESTAQGQQDQPTMLPSDEAPRIPGFRHRATLGTGGFATVYRYEQEGLGRDVAVKVLDHDLVGELRDLFRAEANVMARLSNHPHIVTIYQAGLTTDARPYLVMQMCPPPHLGTLLHRERFSVARATQIGVQVAGAVETAHRMGILHRDIKPANILFSEFRHPMLADFGISDSTSLEGPAAHAFSPAWAPPEQMASGASDASGDIYSLAATLWAVLTGASPFETRAATDDWDMVPGHLDRHDVPDQLEASLRRALDPDPAHRHDSALDFAHELQQVQRLMGSPVTTVEVWEGDPTDAESTVLASPTSAGTSTSAAASGDAEGPQPTRTHTRSDLPPAPGPDPHPPTEAPKTDGQDPGGQDAGGQDAVERESTRFVALPPPTNVAMPAPTNAAMPAPTHVDMPTPAQTPPPAQAIGSPPPPPNAAAPPSHTPPAPPSPAPQQPDHPRLPPIAGGPQLPSSMRPYVPGQPLTPPRPSPATPSAAIWIGLALLVAALIAVAVWAFPRLTGGDPAPVDPSPSVSEPAPTDPAPASDPPEPDPTQPGPEEPDPTAPDPTQPAPTSASPSGPTSDGPIILEPEGGLGPAGEN